MIKDLAEIIRLIALAIRYFRQQVRAKELDDAIKKAVEKKDPSDLDALFNRRM